MCDPPCPRCNSNLQLVSKMHKNSAELSNMWRKYWCSTCKAPFFAKEVIVYADIETEMETVEYCLSLIGGENDD